MDTVIEKLEDTEKIRTEYEESDGGIIKRLGEESL